MTRNSAPFSPLGPNDPREVAGYRIRALIGAGGMGSVYLSHTRGGQPIALKVVRAEFAQDPEFRRRFTAEVRAARQVQGLFTVPVLDSNTEGDAPWLATAFVPGLSLDRVVRDHGPLPTETATLVVAGVAEALQSIHGAGVIHRDLKPGNVLLAADGPKVIDFGIARAADATALTGSDVRVGTPSYMAPEQVAGGSATPAADVFTLGLVAHHSTTGGHPFGDGPAHALMYRILHEPPELAPTPEPFRDLVASCLAKKPEDRPTPAEVIEWCRGLSPDGTLRRGENWLPSPVAADVTERSTAEPPGAPAAPAAVPPNAPPNVPPDATADGTASSDGLAQRAADDNRPPQNAGRAGATGQAGETGETGRVRGARGRMVALVAATAVVAALGGALVANQFGSGGTDEAGSGDGSAPADDSQAADDPDDGESDGDTDTDGGGGGGDGDPAQDEDGPGSDPSGDDDRPADDPDSEYVLAEWNVELAISAPAFDPDTTSFGSRCLHGNETQIDFNRLVVKYQTNVPTSPSSSRASYVYCEGTGMVDQGIEFSPEMFVGTVDDPDVTPEECYEAAHQATVPHIIPIEDVLEDETLHEDMGLCVETAQKDVVLLWIDRVTTDPTNQDLRTYLTTAHQWHQR